MTIKMRVSENHNQRTRAILNNLDGQRILCIAYVQSVNFNRNVLQKTIKKRNALFEDIHIIKNLETNKSLIIDIDHAHCDLTGPQLNNFKHQYVLFSVIVKPYKAQYNNNYEIRYGFSEFRIEPQIEKQFYQINHRYKNCLTQYQRTLISYIISEIKLRYPIYELKELNDIYKQILFIDSLNNRTKFLTTTLDRLDHHQKINIDRLARFIIKPNTEKQYRKKIKQQQQIIHQLKNQLTKERYQTHQRQTRVYKYMNKSKQHINTLNMRIKKLTQLNKSTHYQLLNQHLVKLQPKKDKQPQPIVSINELKALQSKFNQAN